MALRRPVVVLGVPGQALAASGPSPLGTRHLRWRSGRWPSVYGLALVAVVTLAHLWLSAQLLADSWGFGAEPSTVTARMDVAFVRELQQAAPAGLPPAQAARTAATAVAAAASAAQRSHAKKPALPRPAEASSVAATPEPPAQTLSAVNRANWPPPAPPLDPAEQAGLAPPAEAAPAAPTVAQATAAALGKPAADDGAGMPVAPPLVGPPSTPTVAAFEWPPSTRLTYSLTGHYRGPVEGQARVEWLTAGGRYQVHLDASVGPSFAPLATQRSSSEGLLTAAGLAPRRYEEVSTALLRTPRRVEISFTEDQVRLANGSEVPRPPGLQDSASQFVQMTWLFTTQPQLLQPGNSVVIPLALPGRVEAWTYAVRAGETLYTPIGSVATVHVQPQRGARPGDRTVEFWVAPTLQNLPVRILIRQDAENYIDLKLDRLPQQAGGK